MCCDFILSSSDRCLTLEGARQQQSGRSATVFIAWVAWLKLIFMWGWIELLGLFVLFANMGPAKPLTKAPLINMVCVSLSWLDGKCYVTGTYVIPREGNAWRRQCCVWVMSQSEINDLNGNWKLIKRNTFWGGKNTQYKKIKWHELMSLNIKDYNKLCFPLLTCQSDFPTRSERTWSTFLLTHTETTWY